MTAGFPGPVFHGNKGFGRRYPAGSPAGGGRGIGSSPACTTMRRDIQVLLRRRPARHQASVPARRAASPTSASGEGAIVTMTYLLVGVLLFAATLPTGTSTLASGK